MSKKKFKLNENEFNWDEITKSIKGCDKTALSYFKTLDDGNGTINNQSASVEGLGEHLKSTGNMFNFAAIKATLLNTVSNAGIMLAVSVAIQAVVKALDNYIHRVEKAREKTEEINSHIKDINSEYQEHAELVQKVAKRYDELSAGVNKIDNSNLSLSDEDYAEFLDISEQLIDAFPELYGGLDDNNRQIVNIGTSAQSASEYLQELIEKEEHLANVKIANELDDLYKNVSIQIEDAEKDISDLEDDLKGLDATWKNAKIMNEGDILGLDRLEIGDDTALQNAVSRSIQQLQDEVYKQFKEGKIDADVYQKFTEQFVNPALYNGATLFNGYVDMVSLDEEQKQRLQEIIQEQTDSLMEEFQDSVSTATDNMSLAQQNSDAIWADFIPSLISGMKSKANFQELEDVGLGDFAVSLVENLESDIVNELKGAAYEGDIYGYVRDFILVPIQKAIKDADGNIDTTKLDNVKKQLSDVLNVKGELEQGDTSLTEYIEEVDSLITVLEELGMSPDIIKTVKVLFDYDDTNDIKDRLRYKLSDGGQDLVVDDWVDTLSKKEIELANSTAFDEALERQKEHLDGATLSAENYTTALEEVKVQQDNLGANETPDLSPTISSSIQQIATQLEPQFAKLGEAYKAIFTSDGFTLDDIDNSMLENLRQSFAEIEEEVGVAFDASVLDPFFDTLTNGSSTAEQVQEAFNNLATAYFYSTETLDQLTSETADAIEKQLEEMGVQNAAEVVADALKVKTEELIVAKEYLAQTGKELAFVSELESAEFIASATSAGLCSQQFAALQLQKILCNESWLDSTKDINGLLMLAEAAGIAGNAISQLSGLKIAYDNAVANGDSNAAVAINNQMQNLKTQLANEVANIGSDIKLDFGDIGGGTSKAGSAGKEAGDAYLDAFKEELEALEQLRDNGVITEKEYLDRLRVLYEKYFKDKLGYEKEFAKYQRQYLEGYKSLYESALSSISKLMSKQIDGYSEAKESAVSSLTEEKEARLAVIDAQKEQLEAEKDLIDEQIDAKQKIIDGIQDEIDAMKEARAERQRQLDLQKAQYELERMMHQRTILQYSENKGMHYVNDSSGARDAKEKVDDAKHEIAVAQKEKEIDLIQKQIDLLEEKKDLIQDQIDALDKQADQIESYYSKMISETEKYYDSLINNMEKQKSKWEELAEIEEIAQAYSDLEQVFGDMGYTVQDILNGNEQAFEDFKSKYISILSDMNQNTSFQEGLEYASGVAKENFGSIVSDARQAAQELSDTFSDGTFAQAITKDISDGMASAKQELDNMDQLGKDAGDGLINGWGEKVNTFIDIVKQAAINAVAAFAEGQDSHSPSEAYKSKASDAIDGLLLGIEENKQVFIDAVRSLAEEGVLAFEEGFNFENSTINASFDSLKLLIKSVTEALGIGTDGTVGGLLGALTQLSDFSFNDDSIITQFNNLKTAIDEVTSAISGESSGGEGQGKSGSTQGSKSSGNNSEGSSGGNSITGAITEMGEKANEIIGEPDAEGDGTVIGEFGSMKTAVTDVTTAIGGGDSEDGSSGDKAGGEGDSDNLIGSIIDLGETAEETLGEPGGDGVIGRFEKFKEPIVEANEHVHSISEGLTAIDGQEVECTIKVNIETSGGLPAGLAHSTGTALDTMNLESADYNAKYLGKAHVEGTALASGNWAVQSDESNSLVGEKGYEIVVRNGRFFTVGDTGAEMFKIERGDIVFNHEQSKNLLKYGHISGRGKAYADGTVGGGKILTDNGDILRPLHEGDKGYDLMKAFEPLVQKVLNGEKDIISNAVFEGQRQMEQWTKEITNNTAINNVTNNRNMQPIVNHINVTCPGVTEQQVAAQLGNVIGKELDRQFSGFHNYTDQMSRMR